MGDEELPVRDPRYNPPKPEIRNLRPPKSSTFELDDDTEEPWDAIEPVLSPFQAERTERILDTIEDAFQRHEADLDEGTWIAYEALAEATNAELREIVTRMHHVIELGLRRTQPSTPPVTRESAHVLLESLEHAAELLDAHLAREEIAKRFLNLEPEPFDLSNALREELIGTPLREDIELWLDPAPVHGDRKRLVDAILALAKHVRNQTTTGHAGIRLSWDDDTVNGFVGSTQTSLTQATLASALTEPATVTATDVDLPLARAILEHHEATVLVSDLDDGWTGYRFRLPALDIQNPLSEA